ncbi:MAG: hypothetical protein V2A71_05230 [Candidatus Eisenbacteria bacterium]
MLRIQQIRRYRVARYPRGSYSNKTPSSPKMILEGGAISLAMLALLQSCECTGTTGPPPVRPDLVTENEARQIIERVFTNRGLGMERDVPLVLRHGQGDSTELILDGFNDSLKVGYEYIYAAQDTSFTADVRQALEDSLAAERAPFVKVMDSTYKYSGYQQLLEQAVEEFLDTLQAHGII